MNGALWVKLSDTVDAAFLDRHPGTRVICSPTTGLDHVDLDECRRRGIEVISLKGDTEFLRGVPATAELTVGLILSLLRKIPAAVEHTRAGGWEREQFKGRDLQDCVVTIVGHGRIGHQVERILRGFGTPVTFDIAHGDIVSVHLPLTDETRGAIGPDEFAKMKPGAYFINTSRGEIVDENALLAALESGHLAGAALDVVCNERGERNARLFDFARRNPDRLLITCHIGGNSWPSCEMAEKRIAEKLAELAEKYC